MGKVHAVTSPVGKPEVQDDARLKFDMKEEHEVLAHKGDEHGSTVKVIGGGMGAVSFKAWYTW